MAGTGSNGLQRDPADWKTGDEPLTDAQQSYLSTLASEVGESLPSNLTKAEAAKHIERLQETTGRNGGMSNGR